LNVEIVQPVRPVGRQAKPQGERLFKPGWHQLKDCETVMGHSS